MKKILIFAPTAPTSGITQYILNFLSKADLNAFHFDILSFHNSRLKQWAEEHNSAYFDLTISLYKHPLRYKRFLMQVFSGGYHTVHFQLSALTTMRPFKYAKKCGIPNIILHSHNSQIDVPSALRRKAFTVVHYAIRGCVSSYVNSFCACSDLAAKWMFSKKMLSKVTILNNAIDLEKFAFSAQNCAEIRTQYQIETPYVVGNIARFSAAKNQEFLIKAFAELLKKRQDVTLLLVGEGNLLNQNKQLAQALEVTPYVRFVPFQTDIHRYYSAMDLFVLPSVFEGLPITLVEAQANGLPALVSDTVNEMANITNKLKFFSLKEGTMVLATNMDKLLQSHSRYEGKEKLVSAGFSLKEQVQTVEDLLNRG